jgi:hypothetical protein
MGIDRNVGSTDRIVRGVLAVLFTAVALLALRARRRSVATAATVAAIGLGINAVTCFCGLNKALGIDTTADAE